MCICENVHSTGSVGVVRSSCPPGWLLYWTPSVGQSHFCPPSSGPRWSLSCSPVLSCKRSWPCHQEWNDIRLQKENSAGVSLEEPVRISEVGAVILGDSQASQSWQGPLHRRQVFTWIRMHMSSQKPVLIHCTYSLSVHSFCCFLHYKVYRP